MRDYSAKEIAYYNHMFNVPSVFMPGLDTKVRQKWIEYNFADPLL